MYIADASNNRIRKVTNVTVAIKEQTIVKNNLEIYPNPSSNTISLNINEVSNYTNSTITIQSILGQTLKRLSFTKTIDISDLSQGCYFLQISLFSGEIYKFKFIKQ